MSNGRKVAELIEQHVSSVAALSPFQGLVPVGALLVWDGQGKVPRHPVLVAVSRTCAVVG